MEIDGHRAAGMVSALLGALFGILVLMPKPTRLYQHLALVTLVVITTLGSLVVVALQMPSLGSYPVLDRVVGLPVLAGMFGAVLFFLRCAYRLGYGVAEILFGLSVVAYVAVYPPLDWFAGTIAVASAIYVIVRGADNVDNALGNPRMTRARFIELVERTILAKHQLWRK